MEFALQCRLIQIRCAAELSGRKVQSGERVLFLRPYRDEVVVDAGIEDIFIEHRARRCHADNLPFDQPFGVLGVFHLLADGDLVALLEEAIDVRVATTNGDACHRMPAARCQDHIKFCGDRLGIIKECLVEVAEVKKQNRRGVLRFQSPILLHHWA